MLLCLSWTKPPAQKWRWKPGSGSVLIEDYNWAEMLCGFQSVTLFGETSVKNTYNENRLTNPICVAYIQFFTARLYGCLFMQKAIMGGMRSSH